MTKVKIKSDSIVFYDDVGNELKRIEPESEIKKWPELVGVCGSCAKKIIQNSNECLNVIVLPEDSPVTTDYRLDRVRIYVDNDEIVTKTPMIG